MFENMLLCIRHLYFEKKIKKKRKNMLRPPNKIKIIWLYSEDVTATSKYTTVYIDFRTCACFLTLKEKSWDINLHWLDKKKEQCRTNFYFNSFCNNKGLKLRVVLIGGTFQNEDQNIPFIWYRHLKTEATQTNS